MLTLAQRDKAYRELAPIYEPKKQHDVGLVFLTHVTNTVCYYHAGSGNVLANARYVSELQAVADHAAFELKAESRDGFAWLPFYETLGAVVVMDDNCLTVVGNEPLQQLLIGIAPVRLFVPHSDFLEQLYIKEFGVMP